MSTGVAELFTANNSVVTGDGSSAVAQTALVSWGALRVGVSAFTAGTAPTVSWSLKGLIGGVWVELWALADQEVADGVTVLNISPAASPGIVMPAAVRLDWTLGGSPTNATISYSLIGRN